MDELTETDAAPTYVPVQELASLDPLDFLELLAGVPDGTPVLWKSARDRTGRPGIWITRGTYRLKHGSFVDPSDLSCYGADYYEPDVEGRHACLQIGHGEDGPEGSVAVDDVGTFHEAVRAFLDADDAAQLKLIQPDGAFEFHGKLTKGWTATRYAAPESAEGAPEAADPGVLVFD